MKESVKSKNRQGWVKSFSQSLSYLFVPNANPKKNDKEKTIADYLNVVGIFQIHLSEALKEFK